MRRRLQLVPFSYIPSAPDAALSERLQEELPGVLAWAIEGCVALQQSTGLQPPKVVADATVEYFADQDALAAWLRERTIYRQGASERSSDLFADWKPWATARGEEPGTVKRFSEALERQPQYVKKRMGVGVVFLHIALQPPESSGG